MAVQYSFSSNKEFIIEDFDRAKTFASFLPGIAGVDGIPAWAFYVNRGQVLGSFGVKDKNGTIMEFFPANMMYRYIEHQGFRTFIRKNGGTHELFSSASPDECTRKLVIEKNIVRIVETNRTLGLQVTVTYFTMPGENYAALVRKVEIENLDPKDCELEILDGLPQILPAGAGNGDYQAASNLIRSWFEVCGLGNKVACYKTKGSIADTAEVGGVNAVNFYLSFSSEGNGLIPPIFDMNVIFGENTALSKPDGWDCSADELHKKRQVPENKVSGGFSGVRTRLGDKFVLCTLIGHINSTELINSEIGNFTVKFINEKEEEARRLVDGLVEDVSTKTSNILFDQYIAQSYLDNFLRGGYPLIFKTGGRNLVYHVFSRKHGDMEREYNFFSLEPNLYSQGNGNYRDVNQNRRNDVLINPEVGDFNVKHLMSLIQADGYNPLNVKGCTFTFNRAALADVLKSVCTDKEGITGLLLGSNFTPGMLTSYIKEHHVELAGSGKTFLGKVLAHSCQEFEAEFGEGYWSDHWTYNMDLVEAYLKIYPDQKESLLFEDDDYRFFYSPVAVLPRSDKYVLANGKVRQYGSLLEIDGLNAGNRLDTGKDPRPTSWLRTKNGDGEIYETNLIAKLISLAVNKFVSLDPCGMGIEMEANKPGWCDAMNGLPGLFGSGLSETVELKRMIVFLTDICTKFDKEIKVYSEGADLLNKTVLMLEKNFTGELDDFGYWEQVSGLKEEYRNKIHFGISGEEACFHTKVLVPVFQKLDRKLDAGLAKALPFGHGLYPTYFSYEALKYKVIPDRTNPVNGYQNVKVTEFECKPLPVFLEAPARMLKTIRDQKEARKLYDTVKTSELYDGKLKMYKTSVPMKGTGAEVGRLMAFTPGWLEREAVFLHMEYKYLLSMLEAGLFDEFFEDIGTMLIPFLKPEIYGRSTLENSSFIASSANPDEAVHGQGFVARMTGSTAEVLSMWFLMMAGKEVFKFIDGELLLELQPVLPGWLFDRDGRVSFRFLGNTLVTYNNPDKLNTYGVNGVKPIKSVLHTYYSEVMEISGSVIRTPYSEMARKGEIARIEVFLGA
jgi:hypothetical protein